MQSRNVYSFSSSADENAGSAGTRLLLSQLNECLHDVCRRPPAVECQQVRCILEQLDGNLMQYQLELDGDGPLQDAMQRDPWLATELKLLRQEQIKLRAMLRSLLGLAQCECDWAACSAQLHSTFEQFAEHCLEFEMAVQNALHEAYPGPDWLAHGDSRLP